MSKKSLLLSIAFIIIIILLGYSQYKIWSFKSLNSTLSHFNERLDSKVSELINEIELRDDVLNEPTLNLSELAEYLDVSEDDIKAIIITEKGMKASNDYSGIEWFPYFKVDDNYFFNKGSVDLWLFYVSESGVEYNTSTYERN